MDSEFVETYAAVGNYLRTLNINTSSRIAMLSSLVHLQEGQKGVEFDEFYNLSLDQTGEKLEKGSFKTLISKIEDETGMQDIIVEEDSSYQISPELMKQIDKSAKRVNDLSSRIAKNSE